MLGFGIKGGFEVGEKRQQKHIDPDHPHLPLLIRAILIISELNILTGKKQIRPNNLKRSISFCKIVFGKWQKVIVCKNIIHNTFRFTINLLQDLSDGRRLIFCNWRLTTVIKVLQSGAAIFRINVALILPIHFFFPTDVLQSESGPLPHHTSPPAAKSGLPINTRPSTATVALYFTTVFIQLPCQWSIIIRETHFEFILENHQYHFRRQENIMRWRKMGNCDFADLRVFDWVRQRGGDPVATFQAGQINHNFLLSKMIVMMVETLITVTDFRIFFLRSSLKKH